MLKFILIALLVLVAVLAVLMLFYRFYFLRKPARSIPKSNSIISPADGKIVRIIEISKAETQLSKGLFGRIRLLTSDIAKKGFVIVIMMTPLDVHYQRSPVQGTVEKTHYTKGKFLNAVSDAASLKALHNEKNEIVIRNPKIGKVKVVQVAGVLARRIRCFVRKGQKLDKGEELGLICLGSQVILVIPKIALSVKEGQKVVDGETVIARF